MGSDRKTAANQIRALRLSSFTGIDFNHAFGFDIKAHHIKPHLGEHCRNRQANIPQANDR